MLEKSIRSLPGHQELKDRPETQDAVQLLCLQASHACLSAGLAPVYLKPNVSKIAAAVKDMSLCFFLFP